MEDRLQPLVRRSRALSTVPFLFSPGWLTLSLRVGILFLPALPSAPFAFALGSHRSHELVELRKLDVRVFTRNAITFLSFSTMFATLRSRLVSS